MALGTQKMNVGILKNFTVDYWNKENPYFDDKTLNKAQKAAVRTIQKGGARGDGPRYLLDYEFENGCQIVDAIKRNIEKYQEKPSEKAAIDTFDLVYLWGGVPRNGPYSKPDRRAKVDAWFPLYQEFIRLVASGEVNTAINTVNAIDGVGMSYGSKHLKFWGDYPIFDNRLSFLIYNKKLPPTANGSDYINYFDKIQEIGRVFSLSPCKTEEALFAFSEHYFDSRSLKIKEKRNGRDRCDEHIAREIAGNWYLIINGKEG